MTVKNNIPRKIEVIYVRERMYYKDNLFDHSSFDVTIMITYFNGSHKKFYSHFLDYVEFVKVSNIFTEKDRFDFVLSDLFLLKFF